LLGAVLLALAGTIGADTGLAAMASLRLTLGAHGAWVPTLLNVVQLIGWGAFEVVVMRDSFDALSQRYLGVSCPLAWGLLAGLSATLIAALGPLSFVRHFLRNWGVWLLLIAALWLSYDLLAHRDIRALWHQAGRGTLSFGGGIDLLIANAMSWLPLISDYTRFGRSPRRMFRGTLCGYAIASLWFYALGAAYTLAAGEGALLVSTLASASSGIALLLILLGETDNAFADIHSAAVSSGLLARRVSVRTLSLGFGLLCIAIALATPLARYENFLVLIGSVFAPLFGVVLTDHFIVRRRASPLHAPERWCAPALLAWLAGIVAYHLLHAGWPELGATLPALALSGCAYWAITRARRRSTRTPQHRATLTEKTCSASARTDA
jgi:NCS1 family nucleobase:cation symporter-1